MGSYDFQVYDLPPAGSFAAGATKHIENTQKSLDLENGPVFAGNLFNVGEEQYISS